MPGDRAASMGMTLSKTIARSHTHGLEYRGDKEI